MYVPNIWGEPHMFGKKYFTLGTNQMRSNEKPTFILQVFTLLAVCVDQIKLKNHGINLLLSYSKHCVNVCHFYFLLTTSGWNQGSGISFSSISWATNRCM